MCMSLINPRTREINTTISPVCLHKQFTTQVHTLFFIYNNTPNRHASNVHSDLSWEELKLTYSGLSDDDVFVKQVSSWKYIEYEYNKNSIISNSALLRVTNFIICCLTAPRLYRNQWASSTGPTAVSNFKPHLPAQWAVGTHRKGPSRMRKVTSRMNWPIRNSTQDSKLSLAYRQQHNVKPIPLFSFPIGFTERKTIKVP